MASPALTRFRIREFELDTATGELRKAGTLVKLQPQPFRVLLLLVERAGQLVTREEIQHCLWTDSTFVDFEHGINFSINQIREALEDDAEKPRYVETMPRRGYRFIAPVDSHSHSGLVPVPGSRIKWVVIAAVVSLGVFATAGYFYFHRAPKLTDKDTMVLADFANSTGDAVFDDTLKQALSVELAQSPFLNILSDEKVAETMQMMGRPADQRVNEKTAMEICQRTQSAAVLAGAIARLGDQYVIGLNAVNCRTGDSLEKQQVRANTKEDVLKAVDQAATKLRGKLGESLSSIQKFDTPIEQATTPSLEALQAFSLGRTTLHVKSDYAGAVSLFQRAISLDPNFAMAYGSLAASYSDLGENDRAAKNIQKAYELREHVSGREKFYIEAGYYDSATGELEKTLQVCELWERTYPRDSAPHFFAGNDYEILGRYEDGLAEAREALRLDPGGGMTKTFLAFTYLTAGQPEQARTTIQEIQAKKLDSPPVHVLLYALAFARDDSDAMGREVTWAAGKPGVEDVMIATDAGTAAHHGQLSKARQLSRRAIESAERAGEKETAAGYQADAALREALFGNARQVGKWTAPALEGSADRVVQFAATLAMAIAGDTDRAQTLAANIGKRFPLDTIVKSSFLPTIHAQVALNRNNPSQAVEALQAATPYELGGLGAGGFGVALYPVYVRGQAYLASNQGSEAAAEFQKILDHRGIACNGIIGALAHLGMGRAYALQGETAKARAAYQDFLTLWKDADPDIPVLKQAKAEYAKLH